MYVSMQAISGLFFFIFRLFALYILHATSLFAQKQTESQIIWTSSVEAGFKIIKMNGKVWAIIFINCVKSMGFKKKSEEN